MQIDRLAETAGPRSPGVVAMLLAASLAAGWHIVALGDGLLINDYVREDAQGGRA